MNINPVETNTPGPQHQQLCLYTDFFKLKLTFFTVLFVLPLLEDDSGSAGFAVINDSP